MDLSDQQQPDVQPVSGEHERATRDVGHAHASDADDFPQNDHDRWLSKLPDWMGHLGVDTAVDLDSIDVELSQLSTSMASIEVAGGKHRDGAEYVGVVLCGMGRVIVKLPTYCIDGQKKTWLKRVCCRCCCCCCCCQLHMIHTAADRSPLTAFPLRTMMRSTATCR